jgi:hypothetical protein
MKKNISYKDIFINQLYSIYIVKRLITSYKERSSRTFPFLLFLSLTRLSSIDPSESDRVVLVFLPCLEFFVAFIACLRAGLIAVPVYPPDPRTGAGGRGNAGHFSSICAGSGAKVALSHASFLTVCSVEKLKAFFGKMFGGSDSVSTSWPELIWLSADLQGTLLVHIFLVYVLYLVLQ